MKPKFGKLLFSLRSISGFGSAMFQMAILNPRKFANDVLLKLGRTKRLSKSELLREYFNLGLTPNELVEKRGDFPGSVVEVHPWFPRVILAILDALAVKRIQNRNKQFNTKIIPSKDRNSHSNHGNVLLYLTNSLPYTRSGYTLRSQNLYSELAARGNMGVVPVTRYGYPWVIGVAFPKISNKIGALRYERVLPWIFRMDSERAIQYTVEELVKICKRRNISVIHTTTDFTNAIVISRVAEELAIPWIYEVRGEPESTWLAARAVEHGRKFVKPQYFVQWRLKEDEAIRSAWRVIVLSDISKQKLLNRGHNESKIRIIPNGFQNGLLTNDTADCELRSENGILNHTVLIGVISSIVRYEGIDTLIKSLLLLPGNYTAVVVGAGEYLHTLEELAKELSIESRIIFKGQVSEQEAMAWYKVLDVFCVPRIDSEVTRSVTPLKSLPASALGVPIVASDLPALREVTGGFAEYFEPGNHVDLARAIQKSINHPKDLEDGKKWAQARTWNNLSAQLEKVFNGK